MNRRHFLKVGSIISGIALTQPAVASLVSGQFSKNILVLGGTNYIGPIIVQALLDAGHNVTLFNRGKTNPHLFPQLEKLRGDRYPDKGKGLLALGSKRSWDHVIDTWAESPLCIRDTLLLLKDRCKQYVYTSTISVYGDALFNSQSNIDESAVIPKTPLPERYDQKLSYQENKRCADLLVSELNQGCVIRTHSICGYALDHSSDNQRYWPVRLQQGGIIAAPGDGADTTQYVDVKDLADFINLAVTETLTGTFNVCTTERFDSYLYGLKALSTKPAELIWLPANYLHQQGIRNYVDMPMWASRHKVPGVFTLSTAKAVSAGFTVRPLSHTFSDVIVGFNDKEHDSYQFATGLSKAGLSSNMETRLLESSGCT